MTLGLFQPFRRACSKSKVGFSRFKTATDCKQIQRSKTAKTKEQIEDLIPNSSIKRKFAKERKLQQKCFTWLTGAPTYNNGFSMNPDVFRGHIF